MSIRGRFAGGRLGSLSLILFLTGCATSEPRLLWGTDAERQKAIDAYRKLPIEKRAVKFDELCAWLIDDDPSTAPNYAMVAKLSGPGTVDRILACFQQNLAKLDSSEWRESSGTDDEHVWKYRKSVVRNVTWALAALDKLDASVLDTIIPALNTERQVGQPAPLHVYLLNTLNEMGTSAGGLFPAVVKHADTLLLYNQEAFFKTVANIDERGKNAAKFLISKIELNGAKEALEGMGARAVDEVADTLSQCSETPECRSLAIILLRIPLSAFEGHPSARATRDRLEAQNSSRVEVRQKVLARFDEVMKAAVRKLSKKYPDAELFEIIASGADNPYGMSNYSPNWRYSTREGLLKTAQYERENATPWLRDVWAGNQSGNVDEKGTDSIFGTVYFGGVLSQNGKFYEFLKWRVDAETGKITPGVTAQTWIRLGKISPYE